MAAHDAAETSAITQINRINVSIVTEKNRTGSSLTGKGNAGEPATPGELILDKYEVIEKMNVAAGEALLYLCRYNEKLYVAKLYQNTAPTDATVIERLKKVESPYVAQIIDRGDFKEHPVEITEYYANGSLQTIGRLQPDVIKKIVGEINEGLHALHEVGVIHKDLKPSNVMISDDRKNVALIDFGVSLAISKEDGAGVAASDDLTPEFSAPETFDGIFWAGSDYYSLGMTVLYLACGETPHAGDSREEIVRSLRLHDVEIPNSVPRDLRDLIRGLTYLDIKNRNDKDDLNNRWTYEQVKKWLKGTPAPVPPVREGAYVTFPRFVFNEREYTSLEHLILGMNQYWEEAKKIIFDGTLADHFRMSNPNLSIALRDVVQGSKGKDDDLVLFSALYKLNPGMKWFLWKGHRKRDLSALGTIIMEAFRDGGGFKSPTLTEIIEKGVLSEYIALTEGTGSPKYEIMKANEDRIATAQNDWDLQFSMFMLAYQLTEDRTLVYRRRIGEKSNGDAVTAIPSDVVFRSALEIIRYLQKTMNLEDNGKEYDRFVRFIGLEDDDGRFGPQLQAWLTMYNQLEKFTKYLKNNA